MADGIFKASADGTNWTTIYTVKGKPTSGMHYVTALSGGTAARYVRYEVPTGAPNNEYNSDSAYCANIAEIALFGTPHGQSARPKYDRLSAKEVTGTLSWHESSVTSAAKACDGDINTYFDGLEGGYVDIDLGELCTIGNIAYCPREGYEYRMVGGSFSVSSDGTNWKKVYTVEAVPSHRMNYIDVSESLTARYIRYEVPTGAPASSLNKDSVYLCNIAEIAVYGAAGVKALIGDVNSDGSTDVSDLVKLQKYLLGSEREVSAENADINNDAVLDVFDLIALRKLLISQ